MILGNLSYVLMVAKNGPLEQAVLSAGGTRNKNLREHCVPFFLIGVNISFFFSYSIINMFCDVLWVLFLSVT